MRDNKKEFLAKQQAATSHIRSELKQTVALINCLKGDYKVFNEPPPFGKDYMVR